MTRTKKQKRTFTYNKLQTLCDKLKEKDMTLLIGDMNANIGSDNSGYEDVIGRHGLGIMNENGEMLADFCAVNNMIIGSSVFSQCRIHYASWVRPDHRTDNRIDRNYLHITKVQIMRVHRGADARSDHHLVLARMKTKLTKRSQEKNKPEHNTKWTS